MTAQEVEAARRRGDRPRASIERNPELAAVVELLRSGFFSRGDPELFEPLVSGLLHHDPYFVLTDFDAYAVCQQRVAAAYRDAPEWTRMSVLNTARSGKFSSDRTIREYCRDIWHVEPVPISLISQHDVTSGFDKSRGRIERRADGLDEVLSHPPI